MTALRLIVSGLVICVALGAVTLPVRADDVLHHKRLMMEHHGKMLHHKTMMDYHRRMMEQHRHRRIG